MTPAQPRFPEYARLAEPSLAFHPVRSEDRSAHPLRGLVEFGPYSRALVNKVFDPIRIAIIAPAGEIRRVDGLLAELDRRHQPQERAQYLIEFPGFQRVFGLRVISAEDSCRLELPTSLETELTRAERPYLLLAEHLRRAIEVLYANRAAFDVAVVLLPQRWEPGFEGEEGVDFDLHDFMKAITASLGIPLQIVQEKSALAYRCRCSVMWRLGIALYTKAGGVPWKLADTDPETAYVGLSYAIKPTSASGPTFVICCSQVFDADGAGLQFLAYETSDVRIEHDNPFLSRTQMRRLMARSLALYQQRHAGRLPRNLVVHKSTEFKPDEVEGCFDGWKAVPSLELLQVQGESLWRGIRIDPPTNPSSKRGAPAAYPCERGSYLPIGERDVLVWTQGTAPEVTSRGTFFKEGKGIPAPLLLRRFAGHGAWRRTIEQFLGLTKMDWNNDSLYDRLPVTLAYSKVLARTVKRIPTLSPRPYEYRFFM